MCLENPIHFKVNLITSTRNTIKKLRLNGTSNFKSKFSDSNLTGSSTETFNFYFYPTPSPFFSSASSNGVKVNLKVQWLEQNKESIFLQFEISIKSANLNSHLKYVNYLKYGKSKEWTLSESEKLFSRKNTSWNLAEIPIVGILFKGFTKKDEESESILKITAFKI